MYPLDGAARPSSGSEMQRRSFSRRKHSVGNSCCGNGFLYVVHPHDVCSGENAGGERCQAAAQARSGVADFPSRFCNEGLARHPTEQRESKFVESIEMRQKGKVLRHALAKTKSGIEDDSRVEIPAHTAFALRSRNPFSTSGTTSSAQRGGNEYHCSGRPRVCIRTHPQLSLANSGSMPLSQVNPLTSLIISAPAASAACAVSALYVSMETMAWGSRWRTSCKTGRIRRCSSSALTVGFVPGRVDSPPISRMSAPSSRRLRACSTARSGSKNSPPSENESGVTLTTPMMSVRDPSFRERERNFQSNSGRMQRL